MSRAKIAGQTKQNKKTEGTNGKEGQKRRGSENTKAGSQLWNLFP
jgi:hypothetical protein